jgi:glycerate kinase
MIQSMPVLVAPGAFSATLRAPVVAAAIGRGLERAGVSPPPDLCPVAGGGPGTIEVLLPVLGGETGDGFALIEGGGTALVEAALAGAETRGATTASPLAGGDTRGSTTASPLAGGETRGATTASPLAGGDTRGSTTASPLAGNQTGGQAIAGTGAAGRETGARIARAIDAGAQVVVVCAGAGGTFDGGAGVVEAIEEAGGPRDATLVVLCETRAAWSAPAGDLRRDPRGVAMSAAGGGIAGALWARYDATLVAGPAFVLEQLGFDARMLAARAVVVGEARLDRTTLAGRVAGEIAVRARQAGVPCHAIVGTNAIAPLDARILDLQAILAGVTRDELQTAGERLARSL